MAEKGIIKKVTAPMIKAMKSAGEKLSMITAYDFTMAQLIDRAGVDAILVGDSASNVMLGNKTTLPISVEEMIVYARGVVNGVQRAHVVVDMPFGSYQTSVEDAVRNAVRIMKGTGADSLKIEGGRAYKEHIAAIVNAGIPVCGHLGLTPQSVNKFGGYGLRAKEENEANILLEDAMMLDSIGCYAIVLEKIPAELAHKVSNAVSSLVIGIGAGVGVDGQVLVGQDLLGMTQMKLPKFVRIYGNIGEMITECVSKYVDDVKSLSFPNIDESY